MTSMLTLAQKLTRGWIRPELLPLLAVNFINALGYSVIFPILIFLVQDFGGNAVMYGLVGAIYPAFQMIGAPLLGNWSDRIGRKRVLLISQAGTLVSWLIFLLAFVLPVEELLQVSVSDIGPVLLTLPLLVLMLARASDGLTGGNISVANAYLADITEPEERQANFGKLAAAMNIGFIIGPALSGMLAALPNGKMLTVVAAAFISVIGLIVIQIFLPDVKPCEAKDLPTAEEERLKKAHNIELRDCREQPAIANGNIWQLPYFSYFMLLYFLIFLAFNFFFATFPVHAADNLRWDSVQLGIFFTILSGVMIFTQTVLLPMLGKRYGDLPLFIGGTLLLVGSFALLPIESDWLIYASATLYGLGNGMMWPSFLSLLSQLGDKRQQGRIQGLAGSAGSLASIIGLIAGGVIFSLIGANIFWFSAIGLALIALLGLRLRGMRLG